MRRTSDHAIVFGASLAGLLTARVLAEFYKQVTVVERDALPPVGQQRKGVPQGRHLMACTPGAERYSTSCSPASPPN